MVHSRVLFPLLTTIWTPDGGHFVVVSKAPNIGATRNRPLTRNRARRKGPKLGRDI